MANHRERYNDQTARSPASARIVTNIPIVKIGSTIGQAEELILSKARFFESIDYIYVVDRQGVLKGVLSIKDVLGQKKDKRVESVMQKDIISAHPNTHQERVVYMALKHEINAVPIVDKEGHLLGIIPNKTILKIFNEEVREDTFRFGGIFHRVGREFATIEAPAGTLIKHRLPWVIVGVIGGAIAASIISGFEELLSRLLALAAFTPVLAYLSDAIGTQSETLAVRSMALDPKLSIRRYFIREAAVAISLALVCSLMIGSIAALGWRDLLLGLIVGLSMFISIIVAVAISGGSPFVFKRFGLDPAFASGPLATIMSDISTVVIYFVVASALMARMRPL